MRNLHSVGPRTGMVAGGQDGEFYWSQPENQKRPGNVPDGLCPAECLYPNAKSLTFAWWWGVQVADGVRAVVTGGVLLRSRVKERTHLDTYEAPRTYGEAFCGVLVLNSGPCLMSPRASLAARTLSNRSAASRWGLQRLWQLLL